MTSAFRNLKVTIVIGAFFPVPPLRGGAVEKLWLQLAKEFVKQGAQITMISRSYEGLPRKECDDDGIQHLRLTGYEAPKSMVARLLLDFFYSLRVIYSLPKDADIVVTNTFWLPAILYGKLRRRAYVDVARVPKGQLWLYRGVGRLRANSTSVFRSIEQELTSNFSKSVALIPNPLPFDPEKAPAIADRKRTILFVGRVHPEKGLHLLVRALKILPEPWSLRIVGSWDISDGGGGDDYAASLRSDAIDSSVELVGPIYELNRLNAEYQSASIFIYPSLAEQGETFGLAPLEAMAWGCIPVVSDLACFKDFIEHGTNGFIFNHRSADPATSLAQCIEFAIVAITQNLSMENNAMKVRLSHSPKVVANQFLEDFKKVSALADVMST